MSDENWIYEIAKPPCVTSMEEAKRHQDELTKPVGSLGTLEAIAIKFAGFQRRTRPRVNTISIRIYAGDHGVCAQHVSAFPQRVTTEMIDNFRNGGAAISVLSNALKADLSIVNMGTAYPLINNDGIIDGFVAAGTRDFSEEAAMTADQCEKAMQVGRQSVPSCDLFIGGEMGIGNTSSASALFCALFDLEPDLTVGAGTGLDDIGQQHKKQVIKKALDHHSRVRENPLDILACFGGFEIAALSGAYIAAAQRGIPCLIDGFVTSAAAAIAIKLNASITPWLLFAHASAEAAHANMLKQLQVHPILDLGLRLGEGSGAAVCVPIIRQALLLHNEMATFSGASVSKL